MTTLFDMTLRIASKTKYVLHRIATGGSTTSLEDSTFQGIGDYAGGTIFILSGDYAGTSREVLSAERNKLVWATALTGNIVVGVRYAIVDKTYPRDMVMTAVNQGLQRLPWPLEEDITLEQDATVNYYDLPAGVSKVIRVDEARMLAAPYAWRENHYWREEAGQIRFTWTNAPSYTSYLLRVIYESPPVELYQDEDVIPNIDIETLFWISIIELLGPALDQRPEDKKLQSLFQEAQIEWQRIAPGPNRRNDILADY